jgi:hypothetical protein
MGAAGLGAPLTQRLTADGCGRARQTRARVRVLSTGHGRKTDEADAVSVGIAALTATRLNTASVEQRSSPCAPWWNKDDTRCQSSTPVPTFGGPEMGSSPSSGRSWPSVARAIV